MSEDYTPQDNTDKMFVTRTTPADGAIYDPRLFMYRPGFYTCAVCSSVHMRVMLDQSEQGGPFVQIYCNDCKARTPIFELHKPQMSHSVAAKMGLWVPPNEPGHVIDTVIEFEPGEPDWAK